MVMATLLVGVRRVITPNRHVLADIENSRNTAAESTNFYLQKMARRALSSIEELNDPRPGPSTELEYPSVRGRGSTFVINEKNSKSKKNSKCKKISKCKKNISNKENVDKTRNQHHGGCCVLITVNLGSYYHKHIRSDFLSFFYDYLLYCVSLESGSVGASSLYHLHAFFKFKNKVKLVEISEFVRAVTDINIVDVQSVRNIKKTLSYITKEDRNPLYNVPVSSLSFQYQCIYYLSQMYPFDLSHFFVRKHHNCYKYLQTLHSSIHQNFCKSYSYLYPIVLFDTYWFLKLFEWYRNFVSTEYYYKKRHVYIWGRSNVGKSLAVKTLLCTLGNRVYYSGYTLPLFDIHVEHKAIVFEEFDFKLFNIEFLKKLTAGDAVHIQRKYQDDRVYFCKVPIFFVSNYPPPEDTAFCNRLVVIHCDSVLDFQVDTGTREVTVVCGDSSEDSDVSQEEVSTQALQEAAHSYECL